MALILDGTDGITSSGGTNVLQDDAVITANIADGAVSDAKIADVAATKLTGTVPTARLGSGTPDATNFLRGDGSWQVISTTPTTQQVLDATAGASAGAVGTYAFLVRNVRPGTIDVGSNYAGSGLRFYGANGGNSTGEFNRGTNFGSTPAGTWKAMGAVVQSTGDRNPASLFLRIS